MAGVFATIICPLFGMILSNIMWFSPFQTMQQVRESRDMGSMKPIPFVAIVANCTGWIAYSFFRRDHFLFWSNIIGLSVGIYYAIISLTILAPKSAREEFSDLYLLTERSLIAAIFFWGIMGLVCATAFNRFPDSIQQCGALVRTLSCCFSITYYGAPMSTMAQVIREKDSSTLYFPTILVNTINAMCWFLYGSIGTGDILLWLPNGLGVILCGSQFMLIILFKKQSLWDILLGKEPPTKSASKKSQELQVTQSANENEEDIDDKQLLVLEKPQAFSLTKFMTSFVGENEVYTKISTSEKSRKSTPASISWKNLVVSTKSKVLLNNVSGTMDGGMWAIMGSSGSGKTTLMSTLALRLNSSVMNITGSLKLNGRSYSKRDLKLMAGYVMQDDLLDGNFTVLETLRFTAHLRMSAKSTPRQRARRIQEVLSLLDIIHVQDVFVGDTRRKGVSGGERKRLCIAMELLSRPHLLFLDEPTSGLDSHTAYSVMSMLQQLASVRQECTVISTIHQPSTQVFGLFDGLLLMSHGSMVYHGSIKQALPYFDQLGFPCPAQMNPADHLIFVLASVDKEKLLNFNNNVKRMDADLSNPDHDRDTESGTAGHLKLVPMAQSSSFKSLPDDIIDGEEEQDGDEKKSKKQRSSKSPKTAQDTSMLSIFAEKDEHRLSWPRQVWVLFQRATLSHSRCWDVILLNLAVTLLVAFFTCASVWYDIGTSKTSGSKRQPALFFCVIHQGIVASLQGTHSFPTERALMLRERATGAYSISAYFLSKTLADMIVMQVLSPILFSCVVYSTIGFAPSASQFFVFMFLMILTSMAATSLANLAACVCVGVERATVVTAAAYEISRLYGGWFISPQMVADYPAWRFADALSYIKYSFVAVSLNENKDLMLHCNADQLSKVINTDGSISYACVIPPINKPPYSGDVFNAYYGYDEFTLGGCIGALLLYIFICRMLAYMALRFIKT
jgi:ATP-binding cassette subfamily G (WHITE) protein 2